MKLCIKQILVLVVLGLVTGSLIAAELRPFTLAGRTTSSMGRVNEAVLETLKKNGFEILGDYAPEADVNIYVVSSRHLKRVAAKTEYGGFGAVVKVSVTRVKREDGKNEIQIAYNNPNTWRSLIIWVTVSRELKPS